jgi:hypothetical protein
MYTNAKNVVICMVEKPVGIANAKQVGIGQPGLVIESKTTCFDYGKYNALKPQMLVLVQLFVSLKRCILSSVKTPVRSSCGIWQME